MFLSFAFEVFLHVLFISARKKDIGLWCIPDRNILYRCYEREKHSHPASILPIEPFFSPKEV